LGEVIYNIILYKKHFMELTNLQFVTVETFIIQFVILLVVLWVLNRFISTPYLAYLDQWEAKQEKVQADYNNAEAILAEKQKQ
jgi:F0F1-type ATP synthase membrane subunit b/b'